MDAVPPPPTVNFGAAGTCAVPLPPALAPEPRAGTLEDQGAEVPPPGCPSADGGDTNYEHVPRAQHVADAVRKRGAALASASAPRDRRGVALELCEQAEVGARREGLWIDDGNESLMDVIMAVVDGLETLDKRRGGASGGGHVTKASAAKRAPTQAKTGRKRARIKQSDWTIENYHSTWERAREAADALANAEGLLSLGGTSTPPAARAMKGSLKRKYRKYNECTFCGPKRAHLCTRAIAAEERRASEDAEWTFVVLTYGEHAPLSAAGDAV